MTANLHAIWLDDLAPGEGATTPLWDETFANTDDETRVYLRALMAGGPVPPTSLGLPELVAVLGPEKMREAEVELDAFALRSTEVMAANVKAFEDEMAKPLFPVKPKRKKPAAKKVTPRKKPGVLADAEAKLAGVAARVKAQTDELGGPV